MAGYGIIPTVTCASSSTTGAKTASVDNGVRFKLQKGQTFLITFTQIAQNIGAPDRFGESSGLAWTLNIEGTGAVAVIAGTRLSTSGGYSQNYSARYWYISANKPVMMVYDGTYYRVVSFGNGDWDYSDYQDG